MKNYIRTILLLTLGVALATASASAQARRNQLAPPQNGGMAAWHQLATDGQNQADSKQAKYTFVELDPQGKGPGYCYADAFAINTSDQVVVNWEEGDNCEIGHASLWDRGKWKLLDYPVDPNCAAPNTYLTSLTDWGFALGTYWSACPYEPAGGVYVKTRRWYFPGYTGLVTTRDRHERQRPGRSRSRRCQRDHHQALDVEQKELLVSDLPGRLGSRSLVVGAHLYQHLGADGR